MFKRLNNRKKYVGSGMGLSIANRLLNRIGGEISILRSEKSQGTTFLVKVPKLNLEPVVEPKEALVGY